VEGRRGGGKEGRKEGRTSETHSRGAASLLILWQGKGGRQHNHGR
jgi:hypothetical protein